MSNIFHDPYGYHLRWIVNAYNPGQNAIAVRIIPKSILAYLYTISSSIALEVQKDLSIDF